MDWHACGSDIVAFFGILMCIWMHMVGWKLVLETFEVDPGSGTNSCVVCVHPNVSHIHTTARSDTLLVQIPYGYSPVMAVDEGRLPELQPLLSKFMAASARGWQAFVQEPEATAREVLDPFRYLSQVS